MAEVTCEKCGANLQDVAEAYSDVLGKCVRCLVARNERLETLFLAMRQMRVANLPADVGSAMVALEYEHEFGAVDTASM